MSSTSPTTAGSSRATRRSSRNDSRRRLRTMTTPWPVSRSSRSTTKRGRTISRSRTGDRNSPRAAMSAASAPLDAATIERIRASFARQGAMATLAADLADIATGRVVVAVPIEPRLSQQDGFLHAGVVVAALDSACGYAALALMPSEAEVLTVELASGDRLVAEGGVVRAGRTVTVCRGDAHAEQGANRVHVATMLATMVRRRAG